MQHIEKLSLCIVWLSIELEIPQNLQQQKKLTGNWSRQFLCFHMYIYQHSRTISLFNEIRKCQHSKNQSNSDCLKTNLLDEVPCFDRFTLAFVSVFTGTSGRSGSTLKKKSQKLILSA